jgi:hypothetical protein
MVMASLRRLEERKPLVEGVFRIKLRTGNEQMPLVYEGGIQNS